MDKNPPADTVNVGLIPHALEQLSPSAETPESV